MPTGADRANKLVERIFGPSKEAQGVVQKEPTAPLSIRDRLADLRQVRREGGRRMKKVKRLF